MITSIAAYLQVVRNKGAAGVDGMTVEELGAYLSKNGENIREQLRTRKYKPQPVRRVEIPKPDGGTRNLGVPTVVDPLCAYRQLRKYSRRSLRSSFTTIVMDSDRIGVHNRQC